MALRGSGCYARNKIIDGLRILARTAIRLCELAKLGPDVIELDNYAVAARLSYLTWRSAPDAQLADLAARGKLKEPATLLAQLQRHLDDPKGVAVVKSFGRQWLAFDESRFPSKPSFPEFSPVLQKQMFEEADRMIDHVVRRGDGAFEDLFLGTYTFASAALAKPYGVAGGADSFPRVSLQSADERAGILTSPLYLSQHAHFDDDRKAIHRGLHIRQNVLCVRIPPPVNVDVSSSSDRLAAGNSCSSCHLQFETIGLGLERFDALGQLGPPVAATSKAQVRDLDGQDRSFTSPKELGKMLAASPRVRMCMARQWLRFGLGREEDDHA